MQQVTAENCGMRRRRLTAVAEGLCRLQGLKSAGAARGAQQLLSQSLCASWLPQHACQHLHTSMGLLMATRQ